jgi:FkbM family methyltransferase
MVGYDIIYGVFEPLVTRMFKSLVQNANVVLDVGANIGWYTLLASGLVGADGIVIAFEPNPLIAEQLRKSVALNGYAGRTSVRQEALAERNGSAVLARPTRVANYGNAFIVDSADRHVHECFDVGLTRLDDLNLEHVDLIKIDCEGAEARVIEGGAETIARCRPIIISEVFGAQLQMVSQTSADEYVERLLSKDYLAYVAEHATIVRTLGDWRNLRELHLANVVFWPTERTQDTLSRLGKALEVDLSKSTQPTDHVATHRTSKGANTMAGLDSSHAKTSAVSSAMNNYRSYSVLYSEVPVTSFAQNQEDVLIDRAFRGRSSGFYIDIGAGDPNAESVTRWFYGRGWRGVNVEPNPTIFASIAAWRPEDINLNVGISTEPSTLTYYQVIQNELGHGWGLSGFDPSIPERARLHGFEVRSQPVSVVPLWHVAESIGDQEVDFLKIDVEGLEAQVISSVDWSVFRPKLVCVEAIAPLSATPTFAEWEHLLIGYNFAIFDGVNNYYVREENSEILPQLSVGVNCNDRWTRAL